MLLHSFCSVCSCMCARLCVYIYIRLCAFLCICVCGHTYAYECVCICSGMPVCAPMYMPCMCASLCMCVTLCVHVCTSGFTQCKHYLSFQLKIIIGGKTCSEPCDHLTAILRFGSHSRAEMLWLKPPFVIWPLPPLRVTLALHCFSAMQAYPFIPQPPSLTQTLELSQ